MNLALAVALAALGQFSQIDTNGDGTPNIYRWRGAAEWQLTTTPGIAGQCIQSSGAGAAPVWGACGGGGGGYATIQEEGVGLTARTTLNFIGDAITCVDNGGATKTDCTIDVGSGAAGSTTVDFGTWPGGTDASTVITGQTDILAGSVVEAWLYPSATADHTVDEHIYMPIRVKAHTIVAGTGFTITAVYDPQFQQNPVPMSGAYRNGYGMTDTEAPRTYGEWTVAWRWGTGPGTADLGPGTDNVVVRWNGTTQIQDSTLQIDDAGDWSLSGVAGAATQVPLSNGAGAAMTWGSVGGANAYIQPSLGTRAFQYWTPSTGSNALNLLNAKDPINGGTRSTPTLADTSLSTSLRRTVWTSAASTNAPAGGYVDVGTVLAGSTGRGGYRAVFRFTLETVTANERVFIGFRSSLAAPTASADPSAYTGELLGVSADDGDTTLRTLHNDAAGAAVEDNLGASFPLTASAVYDFDVFVPKDTTKNVVWQLTRIDSAASTSGTWTTDIPGAGVLLAPIVYVNSGSVGNAVAVGQAFIYIEQGT